jgi:nucleoside-diphosphate-sugar epimerase
MLLPSPIAVTGASGFIGSWIVKSLLDEGIEVHATVRDRTAKAKIEHLSALAEGTRGRLELFDADLLQPNGFAPAFAGCKVVMHVASPFLIQRVKDPQRELIDPALLGTRNVLTAVNACESVERVVLTSSVAAIHTDAMDHQPNALTEAMWNESASLTYQPYSLSKTLAEREAWKIAESQKRWRLVTVNPSFVVGPSLSRRVDATSTDLMLQFVDGRAQRGMPDMHLGFVDVRDVARAHLLAASLPNAEGRHIISNEAASFPELAKRLRALYGDRFPIPRGVVPKWLMYALGPLMGFSWRYVSRNVGIELRIDNSKSKAALGLTYRSLEETLKDCVDQLERSGLIQKKSKG